MQDGFYAWRVLCREFVCELSDALRTGDLGGVNVSGDGDDGLAIRDESLRLLWRGNAWVGQPALYIEIMI
jgi:hypothetical protein